MENQFWCLKIVNKELFYDFLKKKWVKREEYTGNLYPATYPCRSWRTAKRHLKKHDEIPKGTKFILVNKNIGYDRRLIKR